MFVDTRTANHAAIRVPTPSGLPSLQRASQIILFAPDGEIFAQGDRSGTIYRVEFGAVRVYRLHADGRRQVVSFHLAGETFGLEAGRFHTFFAEAIIHTGVSKIGSIMDQSVSPEFMVLALEGFIRAQEHVLVVGRQSAVEKLAAFLMDIADRQGDLKHIDLPMTRIDIGEYLGMTIETVSRSFSKLRDEGILRLHGARAVEVLKPECLRRLCQ